MRERTNSLPPPMPRYVRPNEACEQVVWYLLARPTLSRQAKGSTKGASRKGSLHEESWVFKLFIALKVLGPHGFGILLAPAVGAESSRRQASQLM